MAYQDQSPRSVIKVKAALQAAEGSSPEIRRFSVTLGDSDDAYSAILKAVRSIFSLATARKCSLFWKDDDDDLVHFSTSEELRHAVDNIRDDTLRLYVTAGCESAQDGEVDRALGAEERHVKLEAPEMTSSCAPPPFAFHPPPPPLHPNHHHPLRPHHRFVHSPWAGPAGPCGKMGRKMAKKMWKIQKKIHKAGYKEHPGAAECQLAAAAETAAAQDVLGLWQGFGHHGWKRCKGRAWSSGKRHKYSSSSSSESDSDTDGHHATVKGYKVSAEFRKFVRSSMKLLHKTKGGQATSSQEKVTLSGLAPEVTDFVRQLLLEWHVKLTHKPPQVVAREMATEERSLPQGLQQGDFQWLCRFTARWHRRHAAKCDVMANWSSSSSSDEEGDIRLFSAFGPWPRHHPCHFPAAMTATCPFGAPPFGHGGPCHRGGPLAFSGAGFHPGVGLPFTTDPRDARMGPHGGMGHPPPRYCFPNLYPDLSVPEVRTPGDDRQETIAGQQSRSSEDAVEQVTQGVKRM